MLLAIGANALLTAANIAWTLEPEESTAFGTTAAVALLPVDEKRQPKGEVALFHAPQASWMEWGGEPGKIECKLKLAELPKGSDRLLIIVYTYSAAGPVSDLRGLYLVVDGVIEHRLDLRANGEAAIIIGEAYLRSGQWKFRALAEGSAYGLGALGRRIGLTIDEANPERRGLGQERTRPFDMPHGASGTGFAVSGSALVTCAHVIEGMTDIHISSLSGRLKAEPVMVDRRNDIALLRVSGVTLAPVQFSGVAACSLGDPVVAVGYPMSGFAGGGAHVTQGGVSALFGLGNDSSLLQFTAAIQPGSSGSPLFDTTGSVIGMVNSSVPDAQNMNFALKSVLLLSFLDACHVSPSKGVEIPSLSAADIARRVQPSLWKIEARN
jgi:S1-C subfamily serine protease